MKNLANKIILEQIDKKIKQLSTLCNISLPVEGWIYNIRQSIGYFPQTVGQ